MVKRKKSNPVKINDVTRAGLSWNLGESSVTDPTSSVVSNGVCDNEDRNVSVEVQEDNDTSVDCLDTPLTPFKPKRRRKQEVDPILQSLIDDCDFYVRINDGNSVDSHKYVGEIGYFEFQLVDVTFADIPKATHGWLYVSKIPNRSFHYYECHKSTVSTARRKNEELEIKYFVVDLDPSLYSLLHALSKQYLRKYFVLRMENGEASSSLVSIKVMLASTCLVTNRIPFGGVRRDIQTIVKQLCGISPTDYSGVELKNQQTINNFFQSILSIHCREEDNCQIDVQHPGIKLDLRPYQIKAVQWMLKKENYNDYLSRSCGLENEDLNLLYEEVKLTNGVVVYYNRFGGLFVEAKPLRRRQLPGGILADEMGLGKTIEVLTCILCHQRPVDFDSTNFLQLSDQISCYRNAAAEKFECVCGEPNFGSDSENVIQCVQCGSWQHKDCVKYENEDSDECKYFCPHCVINQKCIPSRATLIVTPASIIQQWVYEIHKHIYSNSMRLLIYTGVHSMGFVQPSTLADNDLVLMTYATLRKELSYTDLPHTNSESQRSLRHPKRFMAIPSPLVAVEWWRICLDEAQMVESPTAKTAEMALRLSAVNRWCITGTPIQKSVNDLYGLLLFLGVDPYCVEVWWKECLLKPYQYGDQELLHNVIAKVLWRTAKKDVLDQINIPSQDDSIHWLSFSPVEEHFYRTQHVACSNDVVTALNQYTDDSLKLNSLDRHHLSKLLAPFLRLRQACCHPQAVRGHMLPMHRNTMTMEELLESLIKAAKMDSERAHRGLVASLNGLSAIHIIKEEWAEAVEKYREVLRSVVELEPIIRTDKLQRIHTLHNLNEVLTAGHEGIPPTLRDGTLMEETKQIKHVFLEKFRVKVRQSRDVLEITSKTVEELSQKVDTVNPWWLDVINWARQHDRESDLIERIQNDLASISTSSNLDLSIKNQFRDVAGLCYILKIRLDDLHNSHSKLNTAVQALDNEPSQDVIIDTVECHLRVSKRKVKKKCIYCQVDGLFNHYESRLFSISEDGSENEPAENNENLLGPLRRGNWADSEVEKSLKAILAFGRSQNFKRKWIDDGQIHLKLFEALKKDFRSMRGVWMKLRDQASAIDEVSQATIRLSIRYDNESEKTGTIAPHEVEQQKTQLLTSVIVERNELQKKLGQLHYLTNLSKSDYGRKGGSNPEPCPICQHSLGEKWTVFICGHCFCMECFQILISTSCHHFNRRWKLKCPVCRQQSSDIEVSYVSTKQEEANTKEIDVKGSHSTKIEAVVRQLLQIKKENSYAKSILFSTWQSVLDVLKSALQDNDIQFTSLCPGNKFHHNLENFKNDPNINVLLLLTQTGANGLNIIEATHVFLIEPILNSAIELQAIGRVHRIGQTKRTIIHRFIVRETIEERIHHFSKMINTDTSNQYSTDENCITLGNLRNLFISRSVEECNPR